jgi:hypothetical protein
VRRGRARDPHWVIADKPGHDTVRQQYDKGARLWVYPGTGSVYSGETAEQMARDFEAARQDEDVYNGGG